jgi:DivIVA domain-containing protein
MPPLDPLGAVLLMQMAISFSRPDPSSPAAVSSAAFPTNRRGFDQGEVRDFLRMVAAELARLQERERFLEAELRGMQTRGLSAPGRLDEETVTTLLGEEAARVLSTARDASTQIRDRAEESATRLVKDAAEDAARIRESAMLEAARIREDALQDAEGEIEMAKQQGRDMVNEAREYREKVLSELSRRRDAARSQIEQLLHGRDRLLNAFERARLASEDVIGGLSDAHDEPEFIVDLSPTTGPIPIVNPEHPSVKVFDHEQESEPVSSQSESTLVTHQYTVVEEVTSEESVTEEVLTQLHEQTDNVATTLTHNREADELEVLAEAVEVIEASISDVTQLAPTNESASEHPVHSPDTQTSDTQSDATDNQTNVVALFGRGRRSVEVPSVEVPEVGEASEVVEASDAATAVSAKKAPKELDDIFAKLRAGSPAEVASKAAPKADPKAAPKADHTAAPKPEPKAAPKADSKKAKRVAPVADPARFETRDEVLAPIVVAMARKLKRVLADEQNTVLAHLKLKRSSLEVDAILGTSEEQSLRYATSVLEECMTSASAGAKSVKSSGGNSRRVTQKAVSQHVSDTVAAGLVAAFREEARIAIGEAEGDRDILSSLMRDVYRKWKMELIDSHVDDIACSTYSKGGFLSLEPGAHVGWMVDPVSKCCSECEDNMLAGAVIRGDDFPTGHAHPPAHAGCRCLVSPIQD